MDPRRPPFWHLSRQQHRDDRLWVREEETVMIYKLRKLYCPCSKYEGGKMCTVSNVRDHLVHHGRENPF
jgi:hypothetical protein